ncbi:hypothetical protein LOS15_15875 [Halomonas sp. 7T]|uniref:hypothetical protein n=1 Tax=Halomonas sp. 7T TaxID=2893469 RepID=UPI0021DAB1CC|nr:hypothetical protein [Halomonas sp. 7T]UXZ54265.1 hypothetical protein LOS15_15875 [Halomonas sp. 7T]
MTPDDHQRVIDELQTLIEETQQTLTRFEATGMDEELAADYEKLLTILDNAIKQQREHTKALLLV